MIITGLQTFPLRIPFKPGTSSAASAWGPPGLAAVDSLLVKVTTDQGWEGFRRSAPPARRPGLTSRLRYEATSASVRALMPARLVARSAVRWCLAASAAGA